jgi:hypothetical protein
MDHSRNGTATDAYPGNPARETRFRPDNNSARNPTQRTQSTQRIPHEGTDTTHIPSVASVSSVSSASSVSDDSEANIISVSSASSVSAEWIDELIPGTLPEAPQEYKAKLFTLARSVKAVPELADTGPDDLRPLVRRWYDLAGDAIDGRPFDEVLIDFLQGLEKVKYPIGSGPIDEIVQAARSEPLPLVAARYASSPAIQLLVGICYQLHLVAQGGTWFLSCRSVAGIFRVHHSTAAGWLYLLRRDKVLTEVSKGMKSTRKASEYRYTG